MRSIVVSIFACIALAACSGGTEPSQQQSPDIDSKITPSTTSSCDNPTTCLEMCGCDYQDCLAAHQPPRTCDEERFQCVLACKH